MDHPLSQRSITSPSPISLSGKESASRKNGDTQREAQFETPLIVALKLNYDTIFIQRWIYYEYTTMKKYKLICIN